MLYIIDFICGLLMDTKLKLRNCYSIIYDGSDFMFIVLNRLIIRNLKLEDVDDLHLVLSNPKVMRFIEKPFTISETENFIKNFGLISPPRVFGIELKDTGRVIGHIIFHKIEDSYEIGWIIGEEYWGRGYASQLTEALIEFAKSQNINALTIECHVDNSISESIARKFNFMYISTIDGLKTYKLFL